MSIEQESTGKNFGKTVAANVATSCIMNLASLLVLVVIWGAALFIFWKNNWFNGMNQNLRYVIIGIVFVLPIIIIAILDSKLRKYFYKKL